MSENGLSSSKSFFKDKQGRVVLFQLPNLPLCLWMAFTLISLLVEADKTKTSFELLAKSFLFAWSYLEMTKGVNYFRQLLGLIVLLAIILSFFL